MNPLFGRILSASRAPSVDGIGGGSRAVSQRSADADGVPQSAGRAFGIGHQFRCQPGWLCVVLLSGAMGGVALSRLGYMGEVALSVAAIIGALAVMALIVYVSQKVKGNVTLLIIGVMIGYVASAVIGVLKYFSVEEDIRAYVIWGLGSFARVSGDQMVLFVCIMAVLLPLSFLLIKTMNLLLLGDGYARNLGLNIKRARLLVISCSGVLVAIVTAYCGPIILSDWRFPICAVPSSTLRTIGY